MSRVMTLYTYDELSEEAKKKAVEEFKNTDIWREISDETSREEIESFFLEILEERGYEVDSYQQKCHLEGRGGKPGRDFYRTEHKLYWSLNCCQGDGMAWTGSINMEKVAARLIAAEEFTQAEWEAVKDFFSNRDITTKVTHRDNYYYHYNTMDLDWEDQRPEPESGFEQVCDSHISSILDKLQDLVKEDIKDTSRFLEDKGYDIIEGCESEESCEAFLDGNDSCEFTEDGEYHG